MIRKTLIALAACGVLAACASPQQYDAAADIHAFLIAVRDGDRVAFDAHVDRIALRQQVEGRLLREAPSDLRGLSAILSPALASVATDVLLRPQVFRSVAIMNGYEPGQPIPRPTVIAQALRSAGPGRVCIGERDRPCTLVFTREEGVWRLTAFEGDLRDLRAS